MIALVLHFSAFAHPVGGHAVHHGLDWRIDTDVTRVTYSAEVPHVFLRQGPDRLIEELSAGLRLEVDGATQPLRRARSSIEKVHHGAVVELEFTAGLTPGLHEVVLENGNLPDTNGLHRTALIAAGPVDLVETSLLVWHDGEVVRSNAGRMRSDFAARTTRATVYVPDSFLETAHRTLQGRLPHGPTAPRPWWRSPRTPATALLWTPFLALLALPAPKPTRWVIGATAVTGVACALTTTAGGPIWAGLAAAAALSAFRYPTSLWLVPVLLAASLDYRGAALSCAPGLLLMSRWEPSRGRALAIAVGLGLASLQLLRNL